MNLLTTFVSRAVALLLQLALLLAGALFVASVIAAALLFALFSIGGSLLLGRKPAWRARFATSPSAAWSRFRPGATARPAAPPAGEVIDIEVRDVTPVIDANPAGRPQQHRG